MVEGHKTDQVLLVINGSNAEKKMTLALALTQFKEKSLFIKSAQTHQNLENIQNSWCVFLEYSEHDEFKFLYERNFKSVSQIVFLVSKNQMNSFSLFLNSIETAKVNFLDLDLPQNIFEIQFFQLITQIRESYYKDIKFYQMLYRLDHLIDSEKKNLYHYISEFESHSRESKYANSYCEVLTRYAASAFSPIFKNARMEFFDLIKLEDFTLVFCTSYQSEEASKASSEIYNNLKKYLKQNKLHLNKFDFSKIITESNEKLIEKRSLSLLIIQIYNNSSELVVVKSDDFLVVTNSKLENNQQVLALPSVDIGLKFQHFKNIEGEYFFITSPFASNLPVENDNNKQRLSLFQNMKNIEEIVYMKMKENSKMRIESLFTRLIFKVYEFGRIVMQEKIYPGNFFALIKILEEPNSPDFQEQEKKVSLK